MRSVKASIISRASEQVITRARSRTCPTDDRHQHTLAEIFPAVAYHRTAALGLVVVEADVLKGAPMPSKKSKANQKLGRSIRSIREKKRYSQERFARHAGFERSNYGAIERGEFNVRRDMIVRVAGGLDMTVAALFEKAKM